jgi:hypothetical protein
MIIGETQTHDGLVDLLRARQAALGLSNETVDHLALFTSGHCDKLLGPSRQRGLTQVTLNALAGVLAIKLLVVEDEQQAEHMRPRWEGRDQRQVRLSTTRIAKATLRHATPHVVRALGRKGGVARWRGIGPEARRELMTAVSWARASVRKPIEAVRSGDCAAVKTPLDAG